jgi:hypothetical protein
MTIREYLLDTHQLAADEAIAIMTRVRRSRVDEWDADEADDKRMFLSALERQIGQIEA